MLIDGDHSVNAEPVTNEQPAQVGALTKAPAPLQRGPAPPGVMVTWGSDVQSGRRQRAAALGQLTAVSLIPALLLARQQRKASPLYPPMPLPTPPRGG